VATFDESLWPEDAYWLASGVAPYDNVNGSNSPLGRLLYDAAATESAFWRWQAVAYGSGDITVGLVWTSAASATTGTVRWEVAMAAITPETDSQDVETDGLATAITVDDAHLGTTAKRLMLATAVLTGASLDSVAAGDHCVLKVSRIGGNGADTLVGDAALVEVRLSYSDS
jgi:hypothetical protein